MRKNLLLSCVLLAATVTSAYSQCSPATAYDFLDINNVKARINLVDMWWDLVNGASYEVPKDSGVSALFAGALWISGIDAQGNLKVAAQTYRQNGNDFFPGPLDQNGDVTETTCSNFDQIWKVNKSTIDSFIAGSFGNFPPSSILNWPAFGNPYASGVDQALAPFIDVDGNGYYDATQGDYPAIQGDQALWFVFNDKGNDHTETGGNPLGVQVNCMAYAYSSGVGLTNTTFYHYAIVNKSHTDLSEVNLGLWIDPDLGCYTDDFVGCDTVNNMGIVYNGEAIDCGADMPGSYGDHPPMVGVKFLKTPTDLSGNELGMRHFMFFSNNFNAQGNPVTAAEYANYLQSIWKDSTHLTYGGNGYGGLNETNFAFPGDPSDPAGWSECTAGDTAGDRRMLMSTGPFDFPNGSTRTLDVAVIWKAMPIGSYPCPSFDSIRVDASYVQDQFNGNVFTTLPSMASTISSVSVFPNPASQFITVVHPGIKIDEVIFKNTIGQSVMKSKMNSDNKIDISNFADGIYFLQFINDGLPVATSRLVKN